MKDSDSSFDRHGNCRGKVVLHRTVFLEGGHQSSTETLRRLEGSKLKRVTSGTERQVENDTDCWWYLDYGIWGQEGLQRDLLTRLLGYVRVEDSGLGPVWTGPGVSLIPWDLTSHTVPT